MKHIRVPRFLVVALALSGCLPEQNYRVQVTGTGQGGANIKTIPKETQPAQAAATAPTTTTAESLEEQNRRQSAEIESLQEQIRKQQQELQKLKQSPTTPPGSP